MTPVIPDDNRQAVVIIHGIGEQKPMETLRGFAESIIPEPSDNKFGFKQKFYIKPDELSALFDLRRITVPHRGENGLKTDFFEYYWAHQIRDTTVSDVVSWIGGVFWGIKHVPQRLRTIHSILLLLIVLIPTSFIWLVIEFPIVKMYWAAFVAAGAGTFYLLLKMIQALIKSVSINFVGDAARYFTAKPGNVINRQHIRKEGIILLRKLHGEKEDGGAFETPYKRIVIVSHSLGSVIAYDLLTALWSSYHDTYSRKDVAQQQKLHQMQDLVKIMADEKNKEKQEKNRDAFQTLQSELFHLSIAAGNPWRITDFVTLGSPLAHAQLLMASGKADLDVLQKQRMFSTCPPALEAQQTISYNQDYEFEAGQIESIKIPHHAACFAFAQWTNLWFENDLVGGPMPEVFGLGIRDAKLISKTNSSVPFLSHTFYWDKRETDSVQQIQDIIFRSK